MANALDVIIPHYGGTDLTWRCLLHLWQFGVPDTRIVIVDDASPDNMPMIGKWLVDNDKALYTRHDTNQGCTRGWITGLKMTEADPAPFVMFLNNDVAVMPGVIEAMRHVANRGHKIVCAAQHVTATHQRFDPAPLLNGSDLSGLRLSNHAQTTCFMVERAFLDGLGGFDGSMQHGFGDTDFLVRALLEKDEEPVTVENFKVFHGGSIALKRMGRQQGVLTFTRDGAAFKKKWSHRPDVIAAYAPDVSAEKANYGMDTFWPMGEE